MLSNAIKSQKYTNWGAISNVWNIKSAKCNNSKLEYSEKYSNIHSSKQKLLKFTWSRSFLVPFNNSYEYPQISRKLFYPIF